MISARSALRRVFSRSGRGSPFALWLVRVGRVGLAAAILSLTPIAPIGSAQAEVQARHTHEEQFRRWLAETVWPVAQQLGVTRVTFDRALSSVALDWTLPDLEPPGSSPRPERQYQAEFQTPGAYFAEAHLASLARDGRIALERWKSVLDNVEERYSVPREIVVAIWGRESGFGRVAPQRSAIRVLATQAFMGRRKDVYYPELLAVLSILQKEMVPPSALVSSWAGAMGQPQFLPSKYLRYAVDEDGDGVRDIWHSVPDTLASIANYLREHGWQPERGWGVEVAVPAEVSCVLEGPRQGRPARQWHDLGVNPFDGSSGGSAATYLLMPAGRRGPAFLVTENFYVLKKYNESDLYALFVGHLADRMRQNVPLKGGWAETGPISRSSILSLQKRLQALGYDVGRADGLVGFATRTAVGQWQASHGHNETCFPEEKLLKLLGAS
jgi:lytic murein transglycosylase